MLIDVVFCARVQTKLILGGGWADILYELRSWSARAWPELLTCSQPLEGVGPILGHPAKGQPRQVSQSGACIISSQTDTAAATGKWLGNLVLSLSITHGTAREREQCLLAPFPVQKDANFHFITKFSVLMTLDMFVDCLLSKMSSCPEPIKINWDIN